MPESAARIEPAPTYAAGGAVGAMTMIIDYHALANAPMPGAMPIAKATPITPTDAPLYHDSCRSAESSGWPLTVWEQDEFLALKLIDLKVAKEALAKKDSEIKYASQGIGMDEARTAEPRRRNQSAQVDQGIH